MMILCGSTSKSLAQDLSLVMGAEFVQATTKRFPDGEAYVRIERQAMDKEVVLVQNTYPDQNLVELLLLLDAARGLGADKITCVIPYFGYARQDRRFNPGEALSAKVMLRHLEMEMDRLLTIDLHKPDVLEWFARAPAKDLKAAPAIGEFFSSAGIDLVLGPDAGAATRARETAKVIGCESDHLLKTRISGTEVRISPSQVDARGRTVLIVDDIISTGGTIVAATNELKRLGAKKVYASCTHGLFTGGAISKLKGVCDRVVSTNTLESEVSEISLAKVVAQAL
ncbi:MAG: ribose-phosphate diphosphokinase [Methanomassiliicoccales archaeon]|nr:ribose-phosphate diphosphokinase [Methanomassiliicoccales archaeon]